MPNVLRERWRAEIRAEIESLKNDHNILDDNFNEVFLGVLNAMAHFGFVFEDVGVEPLGQARGARYGQNKALKWHFPLGRNPAPKAGEPFIHG